MHEDAVEGRTVEQVYEEDLRRGAIVEEAAPLSNVVETLDYERVLEAVYVVDARDCYVGIVTRNDVLGWLGHALASPQARTGFPWSELADVLDQAAVVDAINPASHEAPVEPRDPLDRALRNMLSASLTVAPVVSPEGELVGELTLTRALEEAADG